MLSVDMDAPRVYEVCLEKHAAIGAEPVGATYRAVSRAGWATEDEARRRVFRMLKRDRPNENTMCWSVAEMRSE